LQKIEEDGKIVRFWNGLILRAPVAICHGSEVGGVERELHQGFKVAICFAGEFDAEVGRVDEVLNCIYCRINVS